MYALGKCTVDGFSDSADELLQRKIAVLIIYPGLRVTSQNINLFKSFSSIITNTFHRECLFITLTVWKFCSSVRVFLSTTTGPLSLQWKASSILRYDAIPSNASRVVGIWLCPLALSTNALLSVASE